MASFLSPSRSKDKNASYRDMLLRRKLQKSPGHHTRSMTCGSMLSCDSFAGASAPMASGPGLHRVVSQPSGDAECTDDELFSMCMAGSKPAHLQAGPSQHQSTSASAPVVSLPGRCQQQSTSAPLLSSSLQQQQPGDTFGHYALSEQFSFSDDLNSDDLNNAVEASWSPEMNQGGSDTAAGSLAGLQPLSAREVSKIVAAFPSDQPAKWLNFPACQLPAVPEAAGPSVYPGNAAAQALPWHTKLRPGNSSSIGRSRPGTPNNNRFGVLSDMDSSGDTLDGDCFETSSSLHGWCSTSSVSHARTCNSSKPALATMHGSSNSEHKLDLVAAPLSAFPEPAWQQAQPTGSLAAAVADSGWEHVQQLLALAKRYKLNARKCMDFCDRVTAISLDCALQIYQRCLTDVDAAAAACMLGTSDSICRVTASAAATNDSYSAASGMLEYGSIFECVCDEANGAMPSAAALAKAVDCHLDARAALDDAAEVAEAAASCGTHSERKSLEQSAAAARDYAASLFAEAHAAAYIAHNSRFNAWHVDLCGLSSADAASAFAVQLGHITGLEYPGGVLMCVVTGPACNDTIEQTVALEQRLLSCIMERGGVCSPDADGSGSRAGRVGNVVVALICVDPALHVVNAICMDRAAAAAQEAIRFQTAAGIYTNIAKDHRAECKLLEAAELQGKADSLTRDARAALACSRSLTFCAHNSCFVNHWCIDLHGQSADTARSKVDQQLLAFKSMGHPGGLTLRIVTGKGKHSVNQIAVVRPAVLKLLGEASREFHCDDGQAYMLSYQDRDGANDGVVLVSIQPKEGPAGIAAAAGWA